MCVQKEPGKSYLVHSRTIPHRPTSADIVTVAATFSVGAYMLSIVKICYEMTERKSDVVCLDMSYDQEHAVYAHLI